MSKTLESDPRIKEVEYERTSGSDQKYFVTLENGFEFRGYGDINNPSRSKSFDRVRDCLNLIDPL